MKILVIGGSNFIGWHLVNRLNEISENVYVFNRGNHVRNYPSWVNYVNGDRSERNRLKKLAQAEQFDVVFDMCSFNEEHAKDVVYALNGNAKKIIFISSSAAYLENQILPLKEEAFCGFHPQWGAYGEAKYKAECVYLEAFKEKRFPVVIVRPSYVYGPDNTIDRETKLFDRITKHRPVLVPYSGDGVIQLGYIDDLCAALMAIAKSSIGLGEVYNISGNELITLNGLVELVSQIVSVKADVYHFDPTELGFAQRDLFPFENNTYFTSIQKAQKDFGWCPMVGLRKGLEISFDLWRNGHSPIITKYELEDKAIQKMIDKGVIGA